MANHVWQRVNINSEKKEVHNKLEEWFGNLDYSDVRGTVEPVFGKDWKYDIDKVGSKWVIVEDCYFEEDSSYINFCSAWSPADGFLEELMKVVLGIDEEATMDFTGDEESDDFLFAGYGSKRGFHWITEDDNPERPWEEECEEEGLDYDACIDTFYDEVSCITDSLVMESKKIVEGV